MGVRLLWVSGHVIDALLEAAMRSQTSRKEEGEGRLARRGSWGMEWAEKGRNYRKYTRLIREGAIGLACLLTPATRRPLVHLAPAHHGIQTSPFFHHDTRHSTIRMSCAHDDRSSSLFSLVIITHKRSLCPAQARRKHQHLRTAMVVNADGRQILPAI